MLNNSIFQSQTIYLIVKFPIVGCIENEQVLEPLSERAVSEKIGYQILDSMQTIKSEGSKQQAGNGPNPNAQASKE